MFQQHTHNAIDVAMT